MAHVRVDGRWTLLRLITIAFGLLGLAGRLLAAENIHPTVSITGYGLGPYSVSPCAADATDADGSIAKVEFYANGLKIGESTEPPYCYWWTNVAVGFYTITAVATDDQGATGTSAPVTVEVRHPFEAFILTPTNGQIFVLGEEIRLTARTTNGVGTVRVRYGYDPTWLTNAPYESVMTAYSLGKLTIWGEAAHDSWNPNSSAAFLPVTVYVVPARGFPIITSQPTNQIVSVGEDVVLSVSAFAELPVTYQWRFNGRDLPNATNDHLTVANVRPEHAGAYSVLVSTAAGALPSDVAFIDVLQPTPGTVLFANRYISNGVVVVDAPLTLSGPNFLVRLYGGPRPEALALIAQIPFSNCSYFEGGVRSIPTVAAGDVAYIRIIVLEVSNDPEYAWNGEASNVLAIRTGGDGTPAPLDGLRFSPYSSIPPLTPDPEFFWRGSRLEVGTFGTEFRIELSVFFRQGFSYQWQKDGRDIPGASGWCEGLTNGRASTCQATLVLTNLQFADAASYRLRMQSGTYHLVSPTILAGVLEPLGGRLVPGPGSTAKVHGHLGQCYSIQFSDNLFDWRTLTTVTNVGGKFALRAPSGSTTGRGFYRSMLDH
jgi:hypothetical protein